MSISANFKNDPYVKFKILKQIDANSELRAHYIYNCQRLVILSKGYETKINVLNLASNKINHSNNIILMWYPKLICVMFKILNLIIMISITMAYGL